MVFSTIPGLFGYIWNSGSSDKYLGFLRAVTAISPDIGSQFARVFFGIPAFRQFFDAVMSELVHKVANVNSPDSAADFAGEFVQKWTENAQFCPNVIKAVLSGAPDPPALLVQSFIRPAFDSPRTFGIVPLSLRVSGDPPRQVGDALALLSEALSRRAGDLCGLVDAVENPTALPSTEKLAKILPDLGKSSLFTSADLEVLAGLVECVAQFAPDFPVKPGQLDAGGGGRQEYVTYSFTLPSVQDVPRSSSQGEILSPEDEIEKQLREMLTGVDVIPLAAQSSGAPDMVDLLKSQVQLARPDHRLLLEMKIDDFESARKKVGTDWNFQRFLELLRRKFDDRQPLRLEKLSRISLYTTEHSQMGQLSKSLAKAIDYYRDVLRFHLVEKWLAKVQPLADVSDELCRNPAAFNRFFESIVQRWKGWCAERKYGTPPNFEILHNVVMLELPLDRFLRVNPVLGEWDRACFDGIREKKDDLLRQNTFDFTSTFQETPKLLESAQKQLQQAFDAPLPLVKLHYFGEALNTLVFVLTFEGHKEVGADQWLPMTILLLVLADPERLPSTIAYIDHFVKALMDDPSTEIRLISEQTEYTFTMIKSALLHFRKSIDGIGDGTE
jgi:catechol 2,3-dioxygenase-like lactoylglutathione lyase family enzyme